MPANTFPHSPEVRPRQRVSASGARAQARGSYNSPELTTARYDGQTDWYETFARGEAHAAARDFAIGLLGDGPGLCLDLGTGTGLAVPALVRRGWSVIGTDISEDQLERARSQYGNAAEFVNADAHALPFGDDAFDAVVSLFTHTDFDEPGKALREAHRVLRSGGRFVYVGVHPCFGSPFVARERAREIDGVVAVVLPGYATAGWRPIPPESGPEGVTVRVGINHRPLADFLNALIGSGFRLTEVHEPGAADPPLFFAFAATK
jgi:SAM-dependent methyltransferase